MSTRQTEDASGVLQGLMVALAVTVAFAAFVTLGAAFGVFTAVRNHALAIRDHVKPELPDGAP